MATQRIIVQVPMSRELKQSAEAVARESGFSSLQETIRLFLQKFARREMTVSFSEKEERLSPQAERRYAKMLRDIQSGKVKTKSFADTESLMKYLQS